MNFNQLSYLPGLLILFVVLAAIVWIMEKRFFRFVRKFWFYRRSLFSYVSSFLFLMGMGGLLLSLLDVRGPEEKIKTDVPSERTIILIDTSASMLAEDVKPSRLQKAALIAKHFARKAAGHQLSIVAFAEVQKKIVPFTNDLDLIDARLDSLKNLRNHYGSSALSAAIQESIQYFRETDGDARGNIIVLTDGEETAEGIDFKIPKDVHIALVGVGTLQGGRIPLDDGRGFRFGYKKERGQDIITKLNESFFKRAASDIPSAKYWIANTYSLPSEEILSFFRGEIIKGNNQQDMVIKPVLMEWIVVPSLIILLLSYFMKSIRIFTLGFLLSLTPAHAQEKEEPKLTPEIIERLDQLQSGGLNKLERLKLADDLYKEGSHDEALSLYKENIPGKMSPEFPPEVFLNYGTAQLAKGHIAEGLAVYKELSSSLDNSSESGEIREMMDKNVVSLFRQQEEKKKKEEQEKKENKDKKDDKSQSGDQKNRPDDKNGSQEKKSESKTGDPKEAEKKNPPEEDNKEKSQEPKESEGDKKPLPPQKIPAKLKQLMSDDRQLQMKMIENGTRDLNRRKSRKSKDW